MSGVGPVQVLAPMPPALVWPEWVNPRGVPEPAWLRTRHTLEVAARLLPRLVLSALDDHLVHPWGGYPVPEGVAVLSWSNRADATGASALAQVYLARARRLGHVQP
ncbi:hypothetical protein QOL99_06030 [Deinococcus sp. MIMF12]|uniref:Uncharacterized protein n=1 Tax=Deinococcus rhizophilus TaxID=3049544 RepID=A0ABT7JF73_9DEIO|nr:hypothetical protein [Deinococcus rhizophilus]MDL2343708.1 hypothetical protein [Deinococcus rhizophilus]